MSEFAGEGRVRERTEVVGGDDYAILEFDGEDGGSGHSWGLSVGNWGRGLEVRSVVGAVDIVSGL